MGRAFVAFNGDHLSVVSDLSKRLWKGERPGTNDYFRWRYLECPTQTGLIALRNERCVAMLWEVSHDYRIDEKRVTVHEPFDWYVLPALVQSGIGIRAMRQMMESRESLLVVGGSSYTRAFLPRLGWRQQRSMCTYRLSRGSDEPLGTGERSSARATPPFSASVEETDRLDEVMPLYDGPLGYASVAIPSQAAHTWLTSGAAGAGRFITLQYRRAGGAVVGWSLGRIYTTHIGREARVIDVFTPRPDFQIYAWMVGELLQRLLAFSPLDIRTSSTCPVLGQVLEYFGFVPGPELPTVLWSNQTFDLPEPMHLGGDVADKGVIPYDLG